MQQITTPVGRLVQGHPMTARAKTDDRTGAPMLQKDGVTPRMQTFVALAIPKGAETDWRSTPWGSMIAAEAAASWPAGEHNNPAFAWKVTDGDSTTPNTRGKTPASTEGFPGHWIIKATTELSVRCFHFEKYQPHEQIKDAGAIKTGDYGRLVLSVKGNSSATSPGVYVNPEIFELYRAGLQIISENAIDAAAALGATASTAVLPAGAAVDNTAPPAQSAPPVAPATGFAANAGSAPPPAPAAPVAPPVAKRLLPGGQTFTDEQLKASGWADAQIQALPLADVPV